MARGAPLFVSLLIALGCGGDARRGSERTEQGAPTVEVARVNGASIGLSEVRALSESLGISPREALSRLIDERLLMQRAATRGYGTGPDVERAVKRARVRALLEAAVERDTADVAARARRLDGLVRELAKRTPPKYAEQAIASALRDSE